MSIPHLLTTEQLEKSCIVANNRMNRERLAIGSNGYETDLRFELIQRLVDIHTKKKSLRWLDLCCGWGNALIEAGSLLHSRGITDEVAFLGIDLVGMFNPIPPELNFVSLEERSLHAFRSSLRFDLITCVHGLHYLGDKLHVLETAVSQLRRDGAFFGNIDLENLCSIGVPVDFRKLLEGQGFQLDRAGHLLTFERNDADHDVHFDCDYLGADDKAGPNYTGQEAVNSYYEF